MWSPTARCVITLWHAHRVTISLVYHLIVGVHCTNNGTNRRLWLPGAMLLWTSGWRTWFAVQFSVWEERDTSLLWRTVIAVPEQLCPEELDILDHWICPETLWYWSEANPQCINISWTMGPIKMHLMNIVKKIHFIWRRPFNLHTDVWCFVLSV